VTDKPHYNYDVAKIVGDAIGAQLKDLNKEHVMAAIEEILDDYTYGVFGVSVIDALRRVKLPGKGATQCIQTLAEGRAVLVSSYGFNVKTDTKCKCGRAFLVLDEMNRQDFDDEMENMGG
jgi:hypothetical protein